MPAAAENLHKPAEGMVREKAKKVCDCTKKYVGFQNSFCIQIPCL